MKITERTLFQQHRSQQAFCAPKFTDCITFLLLLIICPSNWYVFMANVRKRKEYGETELHTTNSIYHGVSSMNNIYTNKCFCLLRIINKAHYPYCLLFHAAKSRSADSYKPAINMQNTHAFN